MQEDIGIKIILDFLESGCPKDAIADTELAIKQISPWGLEKISKWCASNFAGRVLENPEPYANLYGHMVTRVISKQRGESIKYAVDFAFGTKESSAMAYAELINNNGNKLNFVQNEIDRMFFMDLFSRNRRSTFIVKTLPQLGCTEKAIHNALTTVINNIPSFVRKNDAAVSSIIANDEDLLANILGREPQFRLQIINKLLTGLEKITISPMTFPSMGKLIRVLADSIEGGKFTADGLEKQAELFHVVAKMSAKPKHMADGGSVPLLLDMLRQDNFHIEFDSLLMALKGSKMSSEMVTAIKSHHSYGDFMKLGSREICSTLSSVLKPGDMAYKAYEALDLPLEQPEINLLKKNRLLSDLTP